MLRRSLFRLLAAACLLIAVAPSSPGQEFGKDHTFLEVELLSPQIGGDLLLAQRWREVFEKLDIGVRIRQPLGSDKPSISESQRGTFRTVKVVGRIERNGTLVFPTKKFSTDQGDQLGEWLNELKVYGSQGAPQGQPQWGLNEAQLNELLRQLGVPVAVPLKGLPLEEALSKLPLPPELRLAYHTSAESDRSNWSHAVVEGEVQGLAVGTSLAYLLSQQGLAMRPLRQPNGSVQLLVLTATEAKDPWPIGHTPPDTQPRNQLVPKLFTLLTTGVDSSPLGEVLTSIEEKSGVRLLVDRRDARTRKIDIDQKLVSYPTKRTSFALIVEALCHSSYLTVKYKLDDGGRAFLYIAPFPTYAPRPDSVRSTERK